MQDDSGSRPTTPSAPAVPEQTSEEKAAAEAACRKELSCWAERYNIGASSRCEGLVERLAKNSHEWTDGWIEPKFSHYRWRDQGKGVVTYIGDKIQFQNGFGAMINHVYECDYDPASEKVLDVRAREGRL